MSNINANSSTDKADSPYHKYMPSGITSMSDIAPQSTPSTFKPSSGNNHSNPSATASSSTTATRKSSSSASSSKASQSRRPPSLLFPCTVVGCNQSFARHSGLQAHLISHGVGHTANLLKAKAAAAAAAASTAGTGSNIGETELQIATDKAETDSNNQLSTSANSSDISSSSTLSLTPPLASVSVSPPTPYSMTSVAVSSLSLTQSSPPSSSTLHSPANAAESPGVLSTHLNGVNNASFKDMQLQPQPVESGLDDSSVSNTSLKSKDKIFRCELCPQTFSRSHDLKRHYYVHSVSKPYPCPRCGKGFARRDALRRHEAALKEGKKVHCVPLSAAELALLSTSSAPSASSSSSNLILNENSDGGDESGEIDCGEVSENKSNMYVTSSASPSLVSSSTSSVSSPFMASSSFVTSLPTRLTPTDENVLPLASSSIQNAVAGNNAGGLKRGRGRPPGSTNKKPKLNQEDDLNPKQQEQLQQSPSYSLYQPLEVSNSTYDDQAFVS